MGLLAGCVKETPAPETPIETTEPSETTDSVFYVTVGIEQDAESKTSLGDKDENDVRKVQWSNTDQIRVSDKVSASVAVDGEDSSKATFTFNNPQPSSPFNVLYPASIFKDSTHVTLPAVQTYKTNNIDDNMFPMAGQGTDLTSLQVHNLCAILKISVKRAASTPDEDAIVAIRFRGNNNEQVCGDFTIDYENATLTGASDAASDKEIKMTFDAQATSTEEALSYYINANLS